MIKDKNPKTEKLRLDDKPQSRLRDFAIRGNIY